MLENMKKIWTMKKKLTAAIFMMAAALSGVGVAFLAARFNGVRFGFYLLPLIACVDVFVFSTLGFFLTEGQRESLYAFCSIFSAVCIIVQLGILF